MNKFLIEVINRESNTYYYNGDKMKFHIVRKGETLEKVLFIYELTKDELIQSNKHIRNWEKLIPGTKLKIPVITEAIDQDIMEMEPFITDYYPSKDILNEINVEEEYNKEETYKVINIEQNDNDYNNLENIEKSNNNIDNDNVYDNRLKDTDEFNKVNITDNDKSDSNYIKSNTQYNINDEQRENIKKEAKPQNVRKVKYYPYYCFNPYYGQYFLYYYPIYEDK